MSDKKLWDQYVALEKERNDLLAALRSAVNDADAWGLADDECDWLPIARAAIARATGEQA